MTSKGKIKMRRVIELPPWKLRDFSLLLSNDFLTVFEIFNRIGLFISICKSFFFVIQSLWIDDDKIISFVRYINESYDSFEKTITPTMSLCYAHWSGEFMIERTRLEFSILNLKKRFLSSEVILKLR